MSARAAGVVACLLDPIHGFLYAVAAFDSQGFHLRW